MRTSRLLLCIIPLFIMGASVGYAETPEEAASDSGLVGLSIDEMVFCAGVKSRSPVGVADTFPSDVFSVFCFTRILGAKDTTAVVHTWYHGDRKMASIELPVKSPLWRTWSSKKMWSELRGQWRVDVTTLDGTVIDSRNFRLE
jgi:hypothetical protein